MKKKSQQTKPTPETALMDAVVRLVSKNGVENLSTRAIVAEAEGVGTDVYLYRLFGSKENLLLQTFLREDRKLIEEVLRRIDVLREISLPFADRLRHLWHSVWLWLTSAHPETCLFLARYYYCSFCGEQAKLEHTALCAPLVEKCSSLYPGVNVSRMLDSAMGMLLATAFQVCSGRTPDDGTAAESGYRMMEGLFAFYRKQT